MSDPRPIGVFDSGVGGLTVLRALSRRMPSERLVYFGDTGHLPYGSKSRQAVTRFSMEIGSYLAGLGVKMLVVACNTASAVALPELRRRLDIPVLGVIEPGAEAAARNMAAPARDTGRGASSTGGDKGNAVAAGKRAGTAAADRAAVGVIATEGTIASGAYSAALERRLPGVRAVVRACPLFVPLVEEGWWSHPVTRRVAAEYLRPMKAARVDALILGCTHYPLLKPLLQREMGRGVRLIDSAEETAREAARLVRERRLDRRGPAPRHRYFVSDGPERFLMLARRLLGVRVDRVKVRRFE